jgi:hypothetical protein
LSKMHGLRHAYAQRRIQYVWSAAAALRARRRGR